MTVLRVVRGTATPEELAAVVVLLARAGGTAADAAAPEEPSRWADRSAGHRRPLRPGPGAWRGGL